MKEFFYRLATDQINTLPAALIKVLLGFCAAVYRIGVTIVSCCYRKSIFKKYHLNKKVISVGNITLGGVGKTPLVELIASHLRDNGIKPAVLIRGYMDKSGPSDNQISDEALLLRETLKDVPVLVGRNRIESAKKMPEGYSVDVFIMDDGFQHWRVYRDLDIVVIDSTNPFGNGYLIPRGVLREPLSALKKADVFVLTKTQNNAGDVTTVKERLSSIAPQCPVIETVHQPQELINIRNSQRSELATLKGRSVCSFCSIGDPRSFVNVLETLGVDLKKNFSFIDHHVYNTKDIQNINSYCTNNSISTIITTQKDAVKLTNLLDQFDETFDVLKLNVKLKVTKGEEEFLNKVLSLCRYK